MRPAVVPASPSPRFLRFFGGYSCRLLRKRFSSVRSERTSVDTIRHAQAHEGPLIIAMNHPSWWDPIIGVAIRHTYFPDRHALSPIEMAMFERFRFMRKLGMFGIDPEHANALTEMVGYVRAECDKQPRTAVFITPQGTFADVREPIVVRPGIGALASNLADARVVTVLAELSFWHDKRPELLLLARACEAPTRHSTASWTRQIRATMQEGADELARFAIARDENAFVPMLKRRGADIHPVFDLWQRLRGRNARVTPAQCGARA